jgi:hypothetical protein
MKRFSFMVILVMVLSACSVEVVQPVTPVVTIDPATIDVQPGGTVEVKATVNDTRATDFTWELVNATAGFQNLESNASRVSFAAPNADGEYILRAKTTAFESTPGEAKVRVDQLLAGTKVDAIFTANGPTDTQSVSSGSLQPGSFVNFIVTVPQPIAAQGKALFVEATQAVGTGITVTAFSPDRSIYASSSEVGVFNAAPIPSSSSTLLTPQITLPYNCVGPCVIRDSQVATFYVRIANPGATRIDYKFFAYVKSYGDAGEDNNDQQATGIVLTDFDGGAIESFGDVDFYRIQTTGTLLFTLPANTKMDTLAIVRNSQGTEISRLKSGQSSAVQSGYLLEVKSESGTRAGPSGASSYGLDIN